ncbi:hypothetical protein Tco_0811417 [Tanacetum coccineum]
MATTDKESSVVGMDNRPPMLEESDFESWKIRIERYICGKPLGKLIGKFIRYGLGPHPMITVTTGEDVECTTPYAEPLAITTTTAFEVSHEDAYDSDVDEAPHAAAAFMANLMQTGPSTRQGTSNDNDFHSEVQTYDNHFFDNMHLQVLQEIHKGELLDSNVDSVIDDHDNTIPYHQYQLNNEVESVPTDVSYVVPGGISVQNLEQSKVKKDLEQLVFERNKRNADLEEQLVSLKQQLLQHVESNKSLKTESEKLKADNNALEESYLEELVWLRNTNKVVTELLQSYSQPVQTVPMLSKRPTFSTKDLHKSALGHRNP